MAKKKAKKSQKPVEPAPPLDNVPANTGEPFPEAPEAPLPSDPLATDATFGEQSVLSASRVETLEGTIPKPVETSTSASSTHLDSIHTIPHRAAELLDTESASAAELDLPMKEEQEIDPRTEATDATESGTADKVTEDLHAAANEIEQSMIDESDEESEQRPVLEQEPSMAEDQETTQPVEDPASPTVPQRPDLIQDSALPETSREDVEPPSEPIAATAPEVGSEDSAQSVPTDREETVIQEEQMEPITGEERAESLQTEEVDTSIAPEKHTAESAQPVEATDDAVGGDQAEETPLVHQTELEELPAIAYDPKQSKSNEPLHTVDDEPLPPQPPEVSTVQPEPLPEVLSTEDGTEPTGEIGIVLDEEGTRAAEGFKEALEPEEELRHQDGEVAEHAQVDQYITLEELRRSMFVPDALETRAEDNLQQEQSESADIERIERERIEEEEEVKQMIRQQEAEAKDLLAQLEQERLLSQTQDETEAAEQAQAEIETKRGERKESERLQRERITCERSEREALEQVAEARKLLALMEQERRAIEAQEEIEKAAFAERAKRENEQLEYKQMQRERLEQHRRDMEARMAAEAAASAQKEADQVAAARKAIEETSRDRIPNETIEAPMPPPTGQERRPAAEPARAQTPPSAGYGAYERSPGQSDRPFRSYRSFAPHARKLRTQEAGPNYPPKPYAVSHLMEDDIPPAPSPPMSKVRPRYVKFVSLSYSHGTRPFLGSHNYMVFAPN